MRQVSFRAIFGIDMGPSMGPIMGLGPNVGLSKDPNVGLNEGPNVGLNESPNRARARAQI